MCGYFCTGFTDFMLKGKNLLDYTNSFSRKEYEKNDSTRIFLITKKIKMNKIYCIFVVKYWKLKTLKYHTFLKKHQFHVLFSVCATMKMKKYFRKKKQLRY